MMKKRKITALALAAALLISTAAGCSSGRASQEEGTSSQTVGSSAVSEAESSSANSTESGDPVTLRIFCRLNPEVQVDDNPILHELEKKLNIVIDYEAPPLNSYNDKLQITMASGDLPDLIYNHGAADANYEQWVKSGLLAELDDLLPNYPNLMDNIPEEMFEAVRSVNDQKIHLVPRTNMDNYYGFIINKDDPKSAGPDGETGTYDDGLPATYDEFFRLCSYIDSMGDMATIWTGSYRSEYLGYLLRSLAVDYEGLTQTLLNYTFNGTAENLVESISDDGTVIKREATPISNRNGYELYTSAGRYYALDFLHRLIFNDEGRYTGYFYTNSFTGGMSQTEAQDLYLTSIYENERIAMLFDGIWWENEAQDTFRDMSAGDSSMSRTSRRFGFMPIPKATENEVGDVNTMMDTLYSMAFINSNCVDDPVTYDLAQKFLMFANTQQSLEEFTMITSAPKGLNYEISEENLQEMSYFGRSVWNVYKNSDIVYPLSTNPLYLNNQSSFEYASTFRTSVNGVTYTDIGSAMYNNGFTAEQMFNGIAVLNSSTIWENAYREYFDQETPAYIIY